MRHNRLRDIVHAEAVEGGMRPEREKPGLLPARPAVDDAPGSGPPGLVASRRRPADIFFARSVADGPAALDFACSSGLRAAALRGATVDPAGVVEEYEAH